VNGVETYEVHEDGSHSGDGGHPSVSGNQFITRRVLSALPDQIKEKGRYDISIDLYGVLDLKDANSKVSAVLVDGKAIEDYELNGLTLTIHAKNGLASSVEVVISGGTISASVWQVKYNRTDGYRTYRVVNISNVTATVQKLTQKLGTVLKSIAGKLFTAVKNN